MKPTNHRKSDGTISPVPQASSLLYRRFPTCGPSIFLTLSLFICAFATVASAQSSGNSGIPSPTDYDKFSQFITDRNIFDPTRQPHVVGTHYVHRTSATRHYGIPSIQFVGTMNYEKGMFAFFSGNSSDLNEVLAVGGKVQGYTVTQITADSVALQSPGQKDTATVKIGDGLRQEGDKWLLSKENELSMSEGASSSPGYSSSAPTSSSNAGSSSSTPPPSPSAGEPNDILKRLMQQREKENQ